MGVRRVVTGHDEADRAIIASDEVLAFDAAGSAALVLWARDDPPSFPDDGAMPSWRGHLPPIGGCRFQMNRMAPGGDVDDMVGEVLGEWSESERHGMHRTATMDMALVLAGSVVLELDDGRQVTMHAGDVFVQNGTTHRWSNPGDVEAILLGVALGAEHTLAHFGAG